MIASSSSGPNVVLPGTAEFSSFVLAESPVLELVPAAPCVTLPPLLEHAASTRSSVRATAEARPEVRVIAGDYDDESPVVPRCRRGAGRDRRGLGVCRHHREARRHLSE